MDDTLAEKAYMLAKRQAETLSSVTESVSNLEGSIGDLSESVGTMESSLGGVVTQSQTNADKIADMSQNGSIKGMKIKTQAEYTALPETKNTDDIIYLIRG